MTDDRGSRYAEAIDKAYYSNVHDVWVPEAARAVMDVADDEQADLRAEVQRLTEALDRERLSQDYKPEGVDVVMGKVQDARRRAEVAERERDEARAALRRAGELRPSGTREWRNQGRSGACDVVDYAELRAALAPADPEGDAP